MLHLIEDAASEPAQYGALAARLATQLAERLTAREGSPPREVRFAHLPARFDTARFPDAVQHVCTQGARVASGWLWRDRARPGGVQGELDIDEIVTRARHGDVVVPVHPANGEFAALREAFATRAEREGVALMRYAVARASSVACVIDQYQTLHDAAMQDRFGRWRDADADMQAQAPSSEASASLVIALIGSESEQREQYPATLAALGDAADALALDIDVRFVAAQSLDASNVAEHLRGAHAVLLPGGADMSRVAGQIAAARFAWAARVPIVGLCLGMQSMATALARVALERDDIGMREAEPHARVASFVPIRESSDGVLVHRAGVQPIALAHASQFAHWLGGTQAAIRCNHRYRLERSLEAPLARVGVTIAARDASGEIADAIEARDHPFFAGMQGHPELSSREGAAHPLLLAWLKAARER
ncbi:glutamine amidotransferase-related protein [Paraburkholderia sp.]|uniref:glutamine amidotransferase-related protein n=1 Tax=Paraburkholderia sp. TaxID=1926495 RepID=UPI00286EBA74|nr:gamma-glutamyl-gamma-aminobutyrate hydrolase family protein [Paraburkholderia sp.]